MKKTIQVLKIIFLVLAILTMCCTLAKKASAGEAYDGVSVDPYDINSLSDALDYMIISSSDKQIILDAFQQYCPYYQIYFDNDHHSMAINGTDVAGQYVTCPFVDSNPWRCSGMYYLAKSDITPTYILVCRIQGSDVSLFFKTPGSQGSYMTVFNSEFQSLYGSDQNFLQYYDNTGNVIISGDVSPLSSKETLYCYSIEGQHVLMQDNRSYVRPLGETPVNGFSESHKFYIREQPSYIDDNRLKFSTYSLPSGGEYLQTDIRKIVKDFPIPDTTHSSVYLYPEEEITLTLTFVDVNDVESTDQFLLNADNSVISDKYIFSTEFEVFGDFSDYKDVYISACDFSLFGSEQGGSSEQENYKISCQYYLKQFIAPPEIENVFYDEDTVIDKLTDAEINAEKYIIDFSHGENISFSDFQSLDKPDVYENDAYYVYMSDGGSLQALLQLFNNWGHLTDGIIGFMNNIDSEIDIIQGIADYMKQNAYVGYASMVVFVYIEDWTDFTEGRIDADDLTYYYYVTEVGRLRKISSQLGDLYIATNEIGHNTYAIYDFLYTRLNDFEFQSLNYIYDLIGIEREGNTLLRTLNNNAINGFSSVVNAINGLHYVPNYSSLIEEMELIKSAVLSVPVSVRSDLVYLFMPTYDGISVNFQQYHDDIGILALPFDETKLVYDTMKNNYTGNLEIDVPELKVQGFTLYEGTHFSFNVWSLFDNNKLSSSDGTGLGFVKGLRYFIAFVAIYGSVASTYAHIFRRENTQD